MHPIYLQCSGITQEDTRVGAQQLREGQESTAYIRMPYGKVTCEPPVAPLYGGRFIGKVISPRTDDITCFKHLALSNGAALDFAEVHSGAYGVRPRARGHH